MYSTLISKLLSDLFCLELKLKHFLCLPISAILTGRATYFSWKLQFLVLTANLLTVVRYVATFHPSVANELINLLS